MYQGEGKKKKHPSTFLRHINKDFLLRKESLWTEGVWVRKNSWKPSLGIAVAEIAPTATFLTKIGKMQSAGCQLCRKAWQARGEWTDNLAKKYCHINGEKHILYSCEGDGNDSYRCPPLHLEAPLWQHACCTKATQVLLLSLSSMTNLSSVHAVIYDSMHAAHKFVMLVKDSNMSTLWRRREFLRICSEEVLADKWSEDCFYYCS